MEACDEVEMFYILGCGSETEHHVAALDNIQNRGMGTVMSKNTLERGQSLVYQALRRSCHESW